METTGAKRGSLDSIARRGLEPQDEWEKTKKREEDLPRRTEPCSKKGGRTVGGAAKMRFGNLARNESRYTRGKVDILEPLEIPKLKRYQGKISKEYARGHWGKTGWM